MMHLSDKALLVHLSVSQWIAKKLDRKASEQVAAANGAGSQAGRYNKSLLPTSTVLEAVKTKTASIRKKFYNNTLPWGIEGTFILPSGNYLSFMTDFRTEKNEWEALVQQFLDGYEQDKADAQGILGSLFNSQDYPYKADLAAKFRMDLSVMPVPTGGDFRVELADEEFEHIQSDIERRVAEAQQRAMADVWQRLYERVEKFAERLADPKHVFHDSMVEGARETCDLLTRLNFTDDPNLEALRVEVEQKLASHHPDTLRNDPEFRQEKAVEAKDIMERMGTFMGSITP